MGKVYLIGTGPGNSGLLTSMAIEILKKADVVVYDHLINPEIMNELKSGCKRIYVGKRPYKSTVRQNQINKVLIDSASKFNLVARLKGGDPFLFGRGGEEAEVLFAHKIEYELIPGISSLTGVPEYAGIPLTHREVSHGIIVATGHNVENLNIPVLENKLKDTYTLVIFMGSKHLDMIRNKLILMGFDKNTSMAVVENGTYPHQKVYTGTLEKINYEYNEYPALLIIGKVVEYYGKFGVKNRNFKKILIFYEIEKIDDDFLNSNFSVLNIRYSDIYYNKIDKKTISGRNIVINHRYLKHFFNFLRENHIDLRNPGDIITDKPECLEKYGIFSHADLSNYTVKDDDILVGIDGHQDSINMMTRKCIEINDYIIDLIEQSDYLIFADESYKMIGQIESLLKFKKIFIYGHQGNEYNSTFYIKDISDFLSNIRGD